MEKSFNFTKQMIKILGIDFSEEQYNQLAKNCNLLSSESLKYITQRKNFKEAINILREAE